MQSAGWKHDFPIRIGITTIGPDDAILDRVQPLLTNWRMCRYVSFSVQDLQFPFRNSCRLVWVPKDDDDDSESYDEQERGFQFRVHRQKVTANKNKSRGRTCGRTSQQRHTS